MKVEVKDVTKVEKRFEIEVPADRVKDELEEQYQELQRKAHVKGFRPGKAPRKMLERLFRDYAHEKVIEGLIKETLETALDRKGVKPVAEPVLDLSELVPGKPYTYTVHVEVRPEVEVSDYKEIEVTHTEQVVSDEAVENSLEALRESAAIIREPEEPRPVAEDDQVTAVVSIKEGDEELSPDPESEQVIELWRESWIPNLAGRLKGRSVEDEVKFSAKVGDEEGVPERFRGKDLSFGFRIVGMKERILPELGDEFAKEYTKFESLEELRVSIRERLEQRTSEQNLNQVQAAVMEELIRRNPVEVPPSLVKMQSREMARDFMARTTRRPAGDEEAEQFSHIFEEEARKAFQANYILEAIADKESIEASDEELESRIEKDAERMGVHPDKFRARLDEPARESLKRQARLDKTLDFLVDHANIKKEAEAARKAKKRGTKRKSDDRDGK